jgi:NAD(P)-dependent dehydrogenase (short-subunit alcohol dehydrogenase family)
MSTGNGAPANSISSQGFKSAVARVSTRRNARGQGRSHALRLAEEGADIIALDVCRQIDTVPYPMADSDDLVTTVDLIKSRGRRVFADEVDVRDLQGLEAAVAAGVSELGGLDIVVANAGTLNDTAPLWEITEQQFQDQIDVNLTGVWTAAAWEVGRNSCIGVIREYTCRVSTYGVADRYVW